MTGFYPVYAVNPFTGEAFDTDVVTSEPGGAANDMTDPNNRVLLAYMKEAGTLTRTKGPVEDEFLTPPGELVMAAVDRLLRAQDCAVSLEQQLAEANRLLTNLVIHAASKGLRMTAGPWQDALEWIAEDTL